MEKDIIKVSYESEMQKSYIDYAMSVITQRALPSVKDGLKPVHRRILYAMKELGSFSDKSYKKSARIVGDVLGKYHPHGDTSIYDAMVRMAQEFNMLMPLVDGHGNFGSIDGDSSAAMRYTEARLSPIAMELLQDLDKDVIDFKPNFDNTLKEPVILPTKFPNLLVNGSTGIAVGMATSIPSHNLSEVIDACIALINRPNITTRGLMSFIKGPDFSTGGIVSNKNDLRKIYDTGRGRIRIRAKHYIEDIGYGRKNVVITEIPYTLSGNKTKLIEDILELVNSEKLNEVSEVRDESSKSGMRIIIEVKKGVDIDSFINKLYRITKLEDIFSVNMLAILNNEPKTFNLKEIIYHYVEFLKEINTRKIKHELNKSKDRKEILEGFIKAVDIIDLIIEVIRGSRKVSIVKRCLIDGFTEKTKFKSKESKERASKLNFTEKQADAILAMQLQRLVGLEIENLNKEFDEIAEKIKYYNGLLDSKKEFKKYLRKDLRRIKRKYGVARKTTIDNIKIVEKEEKVVEENLYVLIDRFNYFKVVDKQSYARTNKETLKEYKKIIKIKNTDNLCFFTKNGDFHQIKMSKTPISIIKDRGEPIDNLYSKENDKILLIKPLSKLNDRIIFITLKGLVKIVKLEKYFTNRRRLIATKLNKGDKLIGVKDLSEKDKEIILITEGNRKIRFITDEVPMRERNTKGVMGINLNIGDKVVKWKICGETDRRKRKRGSKGIVLEKTRE